MTKASLLGDFSMPDLKRFKRYGALG